MTETQDRMKAQPFGLTKDGKFLLVSDLDQPQETLNGILSKVGEEVASKIDDNAWVIEIIEEHVPFPENFSRVSESAGTKLVLERTLPTSQNQ